MKEIIIDPKNYKEISKLMEKYGNLDFPLFGRNEEGEDTDVSIFDDKIVVLTYQSNRWIRKNIYWKDGTTEELFEGRWK